MLVKPFKNQIAFHPQIIQRSHPLMKYSNMYTITTKELYNGQASGIMTQVMRAFEIMGTVKGHKATVTVST